jgi:hypothetical protein
MIIGLILPGNNQRVGRLWGWHWRVRVRARRKVAEDVQCADHEVQQQDTAKGSPTAPDYKAQNERTERHRGPKVQRYLPNVHDQGNQEYDCAREQPEGY